MSDCSGQSEAPGLKPQPVPHSPAISGGPWVTLALVSLGDPYGVFSSQLGVWAFSAASQVPS